MGKIIPRTIPKKIQGYILLEILIGLFIIGLGFTVVLGISKTLNSSYMQTHQLLQAINVASSTMDEVIFNIEKDKTQCLFYLQDERVNQIGIYETKIQTKWDSPDLIRIMVDISWREQGRTKNYDVESVLYVEE